LCLDRRWLIFFKQQFLYRFRL